MNLLLLLNLALALSTLNEAKSTPFFSGFHFEQTSSADGTVTFQPDVERYRSQAKLVVVVNEERLHCEYQAGDQARLHRRRSVSAGAGDREGILKPGSYIGGSG